MQHVTLIDKDREVLNTLRSMLSDEGYQVDCHTDSQRALHAMRTKRTNLAVINMRMPRMDGISMLEKIKAKEDTSVPVVVLSDDDDPTNELMALRMGAEDFVYKPFASRILLERLRRCLRRGEPATRSKASAENRQVLDRGDLFIDPNKMKVLWKGDEVILTKTEMELLCYLAEKPDYVRSRSQLMKHLYGENIYVEDRVVDSHVKRVRRKIREHDPEFSAIETLYGAGYRFVMEE